MLGSSDFSYYHEVEIIFQNVNFICCPTDSFTMDRLRIIEKSELENLYQITDNIGDGKIIVFRRFFLSYNLLYRCRKYGV